VPIGAAIDSTAQTQKIARVRVYPGASAEFTLYDDDGITYGYEQGANKITRLRWDDAAGKFTHEGAAASELDGIRIEVVRP
jgi:hypothetical protein